MSVRGAAWLLFVCAHQCVCTPVSAHCSGSVGACIGVNNLTPGTLLPGLQQLMLICRCQVSSLHYVRCQLTFANVATWLIIASSQHWMSQWGYSGPHSWWRRLVNAGIKTLVYFQPGIHFSPIPVKLVDPDIQRIHTAICPDFVWSSPSLSVHVLLQYQYLHLQCLSLNIDL